MTHHSVLIESEFGDGLHTKITNADTGEVIPGIRRIDLKISFDAPNEATITVLAPIVKKMKAEATMVYEIPVELVGEIFTTASGHEYMLTRVVR